MKRFFSWILVICICIPTILNYPVHADRTKMYQSKVSHQVWVNAVVHNGTINKKIETLQDALKNMGIMPVGLEDRSTVNAGIGAGTGAAAGAGLGTFILPGAGTVIGGVIGAIGGSVFGSLFGKSDNSKISEYKVKVELLKKQIAELEAEKYELVYN